jgi:hypothetical protein
MIFPTPPAKVNQKVLFLATLSVCLLPGGRREMTLSFTELREIERAVLSKVCPLDAEARLVCLTLINHHNVKDGTCNPSIPTLVDKTGLGETTVRGRLWKLVEEGCLEMARSRPRATYDFKLKMPPWAEEARAARCRQGAEGMSDRPTAEAENSPRDESSRCEPSSAEPEQDSKILLTEKNRAQRGVQTRQLMRTMPSEVQPLVKALQQLTGGQYAASYASLIPLVLTTVQRCGLQPVEHLYAMLADQKGEVRSFDLYRMLKQLQPQSDKKAPAVELLPSLPPDSPLIVEAKRLVEDAHGTYSATISIQKRISAAGFDIEVGWWRDQRHKMAQQLARAMAAERGIAL